MKLLTIFLALLFQLSENYKILGVVTYPGKSHLVMFEGLFRGLATKGYDVDVVSHFPLNNPIPRYNDMSIRGSMPIFNNNVSFSLITKLLTTRSDVANFILRTALSDTCEAAFETDVFQKLKLAKNKYDLVITELFGSDCMLGFGHIFKVPVISLTTTVNLPWGSGRLGNPDNPSYIPNYFTSFRSPMNFMQRLENVVFLLATKYRYSLWADAANCIARNYFGANLPDLRELAYKTSLMLVNSHFSVNQARPAVPNFIEFGGLHIPPLQTLPKHLEEAMNVSSDYKGVIYFSMGSMVLTETMSIETLDAFLQAFSELPYKILWKASREKIPVDLKIPPNIHFEPWMPQLDILCHPNTKLFISHGGLMGTQEAIFCGVPRIGIPLFADQEPNLRSSEALGLAIVIYYADITKDIIIKSARAVLENPSYSKNAKEVSERFKDRPLSPIDTAIYWVEYVIRHKGAPHLRSVGADLPWYQYYLVDVVVILGGSVTVLLVLSYYVFYFIIRFFFNIPVVNRKTKNE